MTIEALSPVPPNSWEAANSGAWPRRNSLRMRALRPVKSSPTFRVNGPPNPSTRRGPRGTVNPHLTTSLQPPEILERCSRRLSDRVPGHPLEEFTRE